MGFDVFRFVGTVDEELICAICTGVLEEPLQAPHCEHAFCSPCIQEWLNRQPICPVDRIPVTYGQLKPVPRILRNMLSRLSISCDNQAHGCTAVLKYDTLSSHLVECDYNPKKLVECENSCGCIVPKDELKNHNCIRELRSEIEKLREMIAEKVHDYNVHCSAIREMQREINSLKEQIRNARFDNTLLRGITDEKEEILRWSNSLVRARVSRWGGMISTPDDYLQSTVRRALLDSGCPLYILDDLMNNCHERNWPQGLNSLETRQNNRHRYENYVCKRIPGKQAVIVLQVDNDNVCSNMMCDPGLVMIFAHGVE